MRRTTLLITTILLATALAGCVTGGGPVDAADAGDDGGDGQEMAAAGSASGGADASDPAWLRFDHCVEHMGAFPLPGGSGWVPEGWETVGADAAGLTHTLLIVYFQCAGVTGEGWSAEGEGGVAVGVLTVPTEPYRDDHVDHYAVSTGVWYSHHEEVVKALEAWGLGDGRVGSVTVDALAEAAPTPTGRATLAWDGQLLELRTAMRGAPVDNAAGTLRFFLGEYGNVTGAMDIAWTDGQALEEGAAHLAADQQGLGVAIPQPVSGFAKHVWGDGYGYTMTPVALPG